MTKQGEIREGIYKVLYNRTKFKITKNERLRLQDSLIEHLYSQGVVIKVKCPDCEWSQFSRDEAVGMTPCYHCNSTGYIVEPLIQEITDDR